MALFDYFRYHITHYPDQRLVISETQKNRWFNTFETWFFFLFVSVILFQYRPDDALESTYFHLLVLVTLVLLRVIWAKGHVEIDAFTQKFTLNIKHHKLFKHKQVLFKDISHLRVKHDEWDDEGQTRESFLIQLVLKNKRCISIWKLSKRPEAQAIWEAVEKTSGFQVKHQPV